MKSILFLFFLIPMTLFALEKNDSTTILQQNVKEQIQNNIDDIKNLTSKLDELYHKVEIQQNLSEKTINGISTQISAASYSLTVFGLLFAIAAIILGIYITYIERKVVRLREENTSLLNQTKKIKDEVVGINELIQKDICGLHLKIKREETIQFLNRLIEVPEDISNLGHQLLSRELEKEDFTKLKEAYIELKNVPETPRVLFGFGGTYTDTYKILFFQHFLDLSIKDNDIGKDLVDFYPDVMSAAFRNDIIKSTHDFIKAIMDLGIESKTSEINSFIKGISQSKYSSFETIFDILFKGLSSRNNQFRFFDLISDEKENRIGKSNFGKKIIEKYSDLELTVSEKVVLEKTNSIIAELEKEEQEIKIQEEKQKAAAAEKKRLQEEKAAQKKENE